VFSFPGAVDSFAVSEQPKQQSPPKAFQESVYAQLRAIAQNCMNGERRAHTLSATALVHEAYLRLDRGRADHPAERGAFLHAAAEAMRRILIEHARARNRIKRGGGIARVPLELIGDVADLDSVDRDGPESILAFDDAFRRLEEHEPAVASVVRLRFFAGLSVSETATALGISDRSVNNYWAYARAWLARRLQNGEEDGPGPTPQPADPPHE